LEVAYETHTASQACEQQIGSSAHTARQHVSLEQNGTGLAVQQLRSSSEPHVGAGQAAPGPAQSDRAICEHDPSHSSSQQKGSSAQTSLQHEASRQFGVGCAEQQSPAQGSPHSAKHGQSGLISASAAQLASQAVSQQNASALQIAAEHSTLDEDGLSCGTHGSPASGSPGFGRTQEPGLSAASWAHVESHDEVQQKASLRQTKAQQSGRLHPGAPWPSQQLPASDMPHAVAQRAMASSTQMLSQANWQHAGSSRQTTSQQTGSSQ
jgi:hypothetical protein